MNLDESAVGIAKSIFDKHYKACPRCMKYRVDSNGVPVTSSLSNLCSSGSLLFKQWMRAKNKHEEGS